jgi:hypothetical protein
MGYFAPCSRRGGQSQQGQDWTGDAIKAEIVGWSTAVPQDGCHHFGHIQVTSTSNSNHAIHGLPSPDGAGRFSHTDGRFGRALIEQKYIAGRSELQ